MDYVVNAPAGGLNLPPIDFRAELNDEQFAAVTAEPGPLLVLAGAGSGKTRTLTFRVAYLLSRGVRPWEILLLTFTNKAAKEMLHRVEDLTGVPARQFWGGTFHHIGNRLLRRHGREIDLDPAFTIMDEGEAESLLKETVDERSPKFFKDKANPRPKVLNSIISFARNTCAPLPEVILRNYPLHEGVIPEIAAFAEAYEARKRKHQVADYDDLLEFWLKLLDAAPEIAADLRRRFTHCLVDEYQDTNSLQARIVDAMSGNHQIMAVGDDAQCIYTWRGANFENILSFPERHPGTVIHRIETNYRSSPEILTLANQVLLQQPSGRGFDKKLRPARSSQGLPCFIPAMDPQEQAAFVCSRIRGLLDEGRSPDAIAVLYRAHYQAIEIQMELTRQGIDFQITSGVRFFEQAHVKDLIAHLRLVYNPQDLPAFQRLFMLLPRVGAKNATRLHTLALEHARKNGIEFLDALLEEPVRKKVPKDAAEDWAGLAASLQDVRQCLREDSPARAVKIAAEGWYGIYLRGAYANYLSRSDDLRALEAFAARYEEVQELLAQVVLLSSETADRNDDAGPRVRLTTVHQAKGLEFDIVFVIGLADGLFPLRRALEDGDPEEERRLFYVAVTRARDELYLVYPRVAARAGPVTLLSPSRFIQEMNPECYESVRLRRQTGW
ncbi:MAG: ATP-dependent helicase [Puniceicoccaceae bacterium]|nr:MAG: ATP-dependent helicase [Puniceicoccaceae bacterium]